MSFDLEFVVCQSGEPFLRSFILFFIIIIQLNGNSHFILHWILIQTELSSWATDRLTSITHIFPICLGVGIACNGFRLQTKIEINESEIVSLSKLLHYACSLPCVVRVLCLSYDLICSIFVSFFFFIFLVRFSITWIRVCQLSALVLKKITKHQTFNFKKPYKLTRHAFELAFAWELLSKIQTTYEQNNSVAFFLHRTEYWSVSNGLKWNSIRPPRNIAML